MSNLMWVAIGVAWYLVGLTGVTFWAWWMSDVTTKDVAPILGFGLLGPLAWLAGLMYPGINYGRPRPAPRVLLKERLR